MIQDIYPHKLDITYRPGMTPEKDSPILRFRGNGFLCAKNEDSSFTLPVYESYPKETSDFVYLFEFDGKNVFLDLGEEEINIPGYAYEDLKLFRSAQPKELMFAVVTAYHLYGWHMDSRYCGRCGAKTVHDERERMMKCPVCGNSVYPRIMPSVIVGVLNGDSILMTRYNRPGAALSALVAGFCEIGETAEDTVRREVMEETGIKVKNIRYFGSQPWGITAGGLLLGYWCELDGDAALHADGDEIAEAAWIKREEVSAYSGKEHPSLTAEMIAAFASGKV